MDDGLVEVAGRRPVTFGRRKVTPRACVADGKRHLRAFLSEVLEDLGFITSECASADELQVVLANELPDLILFGVAADGIEPGKFLETLVREAFGGKVLAVGARESIILKAVQQVGEEYGLAMLPSLTTPFGAETLRERIAMLLPEEPAPSPAVYVGEALHAGWLELWYQPRIEARSLVRCGAEALVRMRHPTWGVVPPAYFIPEPHDPHFRELSEFVIERAMQDWYYLMEQQSTVDLSINLPASYLTEPQAVRDLCRRVPNHPAFGGLTVEIDSDEAIRDLDVLVEVAREVGLHNIGLSIDNLGANWPALMGLDRIPFVKLKADRQFVTGCGNDRLKRTVCRDIVELAKGYGARTVAEGIESRADLMAANELGFDLVQGFLFGKPMPLKKFARSALTRVVMGRD
ncbi:MULTISPECIES: EAL domain-containing response regulator [unclassified Bradyrhizobium]|uniref:EAL domain-containing response regulator n=1 Tax=unclassified Bradyrhizobium TaxID=2631580 RepID=UPI002478842F|nr:MULTISPECIES: EAL domain-containing response regulator [unclassified Bradyrhizobium]WGR71781.1 EAL domain-containing protein [Bradyrhizobium sp. ISRA426]WGR76616.1 EAL domain-containing protein [Bradyrhizobium sp. ISRA430]WGR87021.1 EAL domain-containing protein [Bradyrhizobium sp. ISRA432]